MIRTCDLCLRRAALYPLSYGRPGDKSSEGFSPADLDDGLSLGDLGEKYGARSPLDTQITEDPG